MTQSHSINLSNFTHNSVLSYIEPQNVLTIKSKNTGVEELVNTNNVGVKCICASVKNVKCNTGYCANYCRNISCLSKCGAECFNQV